MTPLPLTAEQEAKLLDLHRQATEAESAAQISQAAYDTAAETYHTQHGQWPHYYRYIYTLPDGSVKTYNGEVWPLPEGWSEKQIKRVFRDAATECERLWDITVADSRAAKNLRQHVAEKSISMHFERAEVNGVAYRTAEEAEAVRAALIAEGIGHHYPGTPEANRALRKHGVVRTPKVGEEWGCGCEFGVIQRFTTQSSAIIRQTRRGGMVSVGETFELPIHVLSAKFYGGGC